MAERLASELRSAHAVHEPAVDDERREALRAGLAALLERDREIVTLTAWEGLTPKEIATVMGTSANLVRVRLHRARAHLQRELESLRPRAVETAAHAARTADRQLPVRTAICPGKAFDSDRSA